MDTFKSLKADLCAYLVTLEPKLFLDEDCDFELIMNETFDLVANKHSHAAMYSSFLMNMRDAEGEFFEAQQEDCGWPDVYLLRAMRSVCRALTFVPNNGTPRVLEKRAEKAVLRAREVCDKEKADLAEKLVDMYRGQV